MFCLSYWFTDSFEVMAQIYDGIQPAMICKYTSYTSLFGSENKHHIEDELWQYNFIGWTVASVNTTSHC